MKNDMPVRIAERENAASVVAITAAASSSPTISMIWAVRMLKNGYRTLVRLQKATDRSKHTTTSIIMLPFPPKKLLPPRVYTSCAIMVVTKNMETPIGPKPSNIGPAGNRIIPYETPSRMLSNNPRKTAGREMNVRWSKLLQNPGWVAILA